ncbi:hypothetical protein PENTCL1PPCAC_11464 [Pristionchus entomophagus]|uniref:Splicing factor YJU2 n=1 Tax=Pristionchus entomophagus TaxID=358040 RepID=A0AAV5T9J6_9BILA|nr:hypothetical protein PENTCL1PPCAC_11464 [Pristionchus entomophagus]
MTGTERKVFQKYYPPDFDPTKLPRAKQPKNRQWVQRVMTPFNMRCNTCNEYIYKGKKFNMKREPADEFYLGMRIWRFYFKCPNCLADISFKTDLENCDYQAENGATRLFEAFKLWKDQEKLKEAKEEEDSKDPMKQLEKRTKISRAEMEAMGKLDEMQELNRRHEEAATTIDSYLEKTDVRLTMAQALKRQEEIDEYEVRSIFGKTEDGKYAKRIKDEDDNDEALDLKIWMNEELNDMKNSIPKLQAEAAKKRGTDQKEMLSKLVVVKKPKVEVKAEPKDEEEEVLTCSSYSSNQPITSSIPSTCQSPVVSSGLAGLAAYGSDASDSD